MKLKVMLVVVVAAALFDVSASAYKTPAHRPSTVRAAQAAQPVTVTSSFTITVAAAGLAPGGWYGVRYVAVFDTGRTYTLGDSAKQVRSDGTLAFTIDVADLGYFNRGEQLQEVEMCIVEPDWPYKHVACTEQDIGY